MWINTKLFKNWLWSHELFLNSLDLDFRPVLLFTERRATLQNSRCEFAVLWTYSFDVFAPWVYHVPVLLLVQNNVHVPSLCDRSYFHAISVILIDSALYFEHGFLNSEDPLLSALNGQVAYELKAAWHRRSRGCHCVGSFCFTENNPQPIVFMHSSLKQSRQYFIHFIWNLLQFDAVRD